jgi:hypothetical protein
LSRERLSEAEVPRIPIALQPCIAAAISRAFVSAPGLSGMPGRDACAPPAGYGHKDQI